MEQIACKECASPDCYGCNMYRLERMLMSGKLDALMNENRAIKMDADVRPVVRGRWKDAMQSCHDSPHVKCSVCGEYYWRYFNKFNFCPNCGADMRVVCKDG